MKFDEFLERLDAIGIPYAEVEFEDNYDEEPPAPPYICYLYMEETRGPDMCPNKLVHIQVALEVYTDHKDEELIKRVEKEVLYDVEYQKETSVISEENLIQTNYDISIFKKN